MEDIVTEPEVKNVVIEIPALMAEIIRDVLNEWLVDRSRNSKAMDRMARLTLAVILDSIDEQVKTQTGTEKEPEMAPHVCPDCMQGFTTLRGMKAHRTRMHAKEQE